MTRQTVPAPAPTAARSASIALDELTGATARLVMLTLDQLHPHPDNPRRDVGDLTELADSIRAHGVRQNLLVVPDPEDPTAYRLVIGHRRTAAARLAGNVEALPAVVDDSLTAAEQLELMLLENLQRVDLSAMEEADAYQGLLDLGLDETAIAERTGRSKATVAARLRLRGLPAPVRDQVHTHQATLADAELLAKTLARRDVQADPSASLELENAFGTFGFERTVENTIARLKRAAERAKLLKELEATNVRVVEPTGYDSAPKGTKPLRELTDDKGRKAGPNSAELTLETHASCPGHVAWLDRWSAQVHYGCEGWKKNGHRDRYATPATASSAAGDVDRKTLIANNKAAQAAEVTRRRWLSDFIVHVAGPEVTGEDPLAYVARHIRTGVVLPYVHGQLYDQLRYGKDGREEDRLKDLTSVKHGPVKHLVALAAAGVEADMFKDFWRHPRAEHADHLRTLGSWGYELSDVERSVVEAVAP
ncbi:ParB/RepB/Spo0J family partition protein [Cellulomonas sp. P4]|uniref:ParB/RepB/Spo0J family partition protein n=1 Tax=Cellulomonas sp. P4 TaxID=3142533 RepID=UPI0031BA5DE5